MKTSIVLRHNFHRLKVVITLVFLPGVFFAAERREPQAVPTDAKPMGYDLQIVDGQLIRPGGKLEATLANVVDALRDQYTEANIIFSPSLAKIKVSDLKLRSGRLAEELEAVRVACGEKFEVQLGATRADQTARIWDVPGGRPLMMNGNPPQMDPSTGLPQTAARSVNAGLFVLHEAIPPAQKQRVVEAFNIGPYLEWLRHQPKQETSTDNTDDYGTRQIQMMIRDTLDGFRPDQTDADNPFFQYHPGATLLIVIGNVDTVEIARKIVNALPGMSAVADEFRGRYGLEPGRGSAAERKLADDAFRARYGLPRSASPSQPGTAGPEPNPSK
jgi:hypothetical protein